MTQKFFTILLAVLVVFPGMFFASLVFARNVDSASSLQEAPKIIFPVAELGSCKDQAECFAYCEIPENNKACFAFAEKYQLLTEEEMRVAEKVQGVDGGPGGCKSKDECETYCDDVSNIDECVAFAEENGLMKGKELEEAKKVQTALKGGGKLPGGCRNKTSCEDYCQSGEHMEECLAFAEASGFLSSEELEQAKKFMPLMKEGLAPGGCKSKDECEAYCEGDEHFEECISFAEKNGMIPEEERKNIEAFKKAGGQGPGGCKGRQCRMFCENPDNQEICFQWAKENGLISEDELREMESGMRERPHDEEAGLPTGGAGRWEAGENFSGPGGCKGEEECMDYCQNNPEECKRFAPPQIEQREIDQGMNQGGEEEREFDDRQYFHPEGSEFFPDASDSYGREGGEEYDRQYEDKYREQYQNQFREQYEGELRQQFQERPEDSFEQREDPSGGFLPEGEPRIPLPDVLQGEGEYHPEPSGEYIPPQSKKSSSNLLGFTLDAFAELLK